MTLATLPQAIEWLRDELENLPPVPTKLHDHLTGEGGTPRYAPAFWAYLTASPFQVKTITETRHCDRHAYGEPCNFCAGNLSYDVSREVYTAPLRAALERLRKAPSFAPTWPAPYVVVGVFIATGFDLAETADALGKPWTSEDGRKTFEAGVLLCVRKLYGRWSSGPIPSTGPRSESQNIAEAA